MLTPAAALDAVRGAMRPFDTDIVPLERATGRVLRQAVRAERDQPPFDRVTMDGIAIAYDTFARGERRFTIAARQHAGEPPRALGDPGQCVEVMTGAVLPAQADCVVPVERIAVADGVAAIESGYAAERGQYIHPQGSDHRAGTELLAPGAVVAPADVAIIASCGLTAVEAAGLPVMRVISTGSELVPAGPPIEAHQVRSSNGPALLAMLRQHGFDDCAHEELADEPALLRDRLARHLDEASVLVLSGGVSMGKADFVPEVLNALGVERVFHKIAQRPGKPMWFGIGPRGQAVFALPGNPVSTLVCCRHYVLPALLHASGRSAPPREWALLTEDVTFKADLTAFLPVRLACREDATLCATPAPTNTSGDFASLGGTHGYVELAQDRSHFPQGTAVPLHRWRLL
ncbi:MAG TPA: molybdopterin molybdotransferase MoeA [Woeseiaceae bacterium]